MKKKTLLQLMITVKKIVDETKGFICNVFEDVLEREGIADISRKDIIKNYPEFYGFICQGYKKYRGRSHVSTEQSQDLFRYNASWVTSTEVRLEELTSFIKELKLKEKKDESQNNK